MLRIASIRSARLVATPLQPPLSRHKPRQPVAKHFTPWSLPSAFPDRFQLRAYADKKGGRQNDKNSHHGNATYRNAPLYIPKDIYDALTGRQQMETAQKNNEAACKPLLTPQQIKSRYKRNVEAVIDSISEAVTAKGDDTIWPTLHTLLRAEKVMIFTGRNTAHGRPTIDGPVATALLAHALYKNHQVAVIVTDSYNQRLIAKLLGKLDANAAKYLEYITLDMINGALAQALGKHITRQRANATVYIDVPARNGDGLYLDEQNNPIGHFNVAFDQGLHMQCYLSGRDKQPWNTIAIGSRPNTTGIKPVHPGRSAAGESGLAIFYADHQFRVKDTIVATLALAELLSAAYTNDIGCRPEVFEALMNEATELIKGSEYSVRSLRSVSPHRIPDASGTVENSPTAEQRSTGLKDLQKRIHAQALIWPGDIEKRKEEGPETHFAVLYDSSDGVLIASQDFLGLVRARSNFFLKAHLVADYKNAPFGKIKDADELFSVVVDGVTYCAMLGPDCVVIVCNTACTVGIRDKVEKLVNEFLKEQGYPFKVNIIDFIASVAPEILEEGGDFPAILCTQTTADSRRYPEMVKRCAEENGMQAPHLTVVPCPELADGINAGLYEEADEAVRMEFDKALESYLDQIPLTSTSIWLCCTHYPALMARIVAYMNKRLKTAGRLENSIPVKDPLEYPVNAFITAMEEKPKDETGRATSQRYRKLPDIYISAMKYPNEVRKTAIRHLKEKGKTIGIEQVVFPKVPVPDEYRIRTIQRPRNDPDNGSASL